MGKAYLSVTWNDGAKFTGSTPEEVLFTMKLTDWGRPRTSGEYKARVQESVATVKGETFLYWDASSFLMGLQSVGLVTLEWEVRS